ncbi:MAG: methyltransferase domain-containing protein [Rhizobacter sp.]
MSFVTKIRRYAEHRYRRFRLSRQSSYSFSGINLGSGPQQISDCLAIDFHLGADLYLDLRYDNLPFTDGSLDFVVCISAINYVTHARACDIVAQIHRVLRKGGVARFAVQDLKLIARKYVERDTDFFGQTLPDGSPRFPGETLGDKFNYWFYGHPIRGSGCKYLYDYEALAAIFHRAGFTCVENRPFMGSRLAQIAQIDNREDQMFFLEAVK